MLICNPGHRKIGSKTVLQNDFMRIDEEQNLNHLSQSLLTLLMLETEYSGYGGQ